MLREKTIVFTIKKSKIEKWGYEITCGDWFHNTAPSADIAVNYLKDRFGHNVKYKIIKENK
jgi:hypothetical protein